MYITLIGKTVTPTADIRQVKTQELSGVGLQILHRNSELQAGSSRASSFPPTTRIFSFEITLHGIQVYAHISSLQTLGAVENLGIFIYLIIIFSVTVEIKKKGKTPFYGCGVPVDSARS